MPVKKYEVSLSATERQTFTKMVSSGKMSDRTILRATILLAIDSNRKKPMTVREAALAFNTSTTTVQSVRTSYAEKGLEAHMQVGRIQKKEYKPHLKKCWCIPKEYSIGAS